MLVTRGLVATRARARDAILRGLVTIDGAIATKPAQTIAATAAVTVADAATRWVSRGAEKLIAGLDAFGFDPTGCVCLDIGASTGGFTDVLLARGAARVFAVDVGHGQLHPRLAADARVVSIEQTDARALTPSLIPEPITAVVADVSFISLMKALPAALALATPDAWLVVLVKPQFEAGRETVGKGGVVRDPLARDKAVVDVATWLTARAWQVVGTTPSPLTGGAGNIEFVLGAIRA